MSEESGESLESFADNGGAEVPDMERLRYVCPSVIDYDGGWVGVRLDSEALNRGGGQMIRDVGVVQRDIDEAGPGYGYIANRGSFSERVCDFGRNLPWVGLVLLGRGQGPVALELTQIRSIGNGNRTVFFFIAAGFEAFRN
jgi:hypothetical protein